MDALKKEPYQFEQTVPIRDSAISISLDDDVEEKDWRLNNTNWCTNTLRISSASSAYLVQEIYSQA